MNNIKNEDVLETVGISYEIKSIEYDPNHNIQQEFIGINPNRDYECLQVNSEGKLVLADEKVQEILDEKDRELEGLRDLLEDWRHYYDDLLKCHTKMEIDLGKIKAEIGNKEFNRIVEDTNVD